MSPTSNPREALRNLLVGMFSVDELRRFVHDEYRGLVSDASWEGPISTVAQNVVELLGRRGLLTEALFDNLARRVPTRQEDIAKLKRVWKVGVARNAYGYERDVRVLFVAADSTDMRAGHLTTELPEIERRIERAGGAERFRVKWLYAPKIDDLGLQLDRFKPDVVYFSGDDIAGGLPLYDDAGDLQLVEEEAIADLIGVVTDSSLHIVVLSRCYSAALAEAMVNHIDCVTGTSDVTLPAKQATMFSGWFFGSLALEYVNDGLLDRLAVERAFRKGKNALQAAARRGDAAHICWHARHRAGDNLIVIEPCDEPRAVSLRAAGRRVPPLPRVEPLVAGGTLGDGRYQLRGVLGVGGFSTVWSARDLRGNNVHAEVSLKILHPHLAGSKTARERFFAGAAAMANVATEMARQGLPDRVVSVIESRMEDSGHCYLVMELVAYGDLRAAILSGAVAGEMRYQILQQVAEALAFGHQIGVIHRDVKPSNILISANKNAKLADFDFVMPIDHSGARSLSGDVAGTLIYSAPEALADPRRATAHSDIYSLSMTAIWMLLSGRVDHAVALRAPQDLLAGLDADVRVRDVLRRGIAAHPHERWASVDEFREALRVARLPETRKQALRRLLAAGFLAASKAVRGNKAATAAILALPLAVGLAAHLAKQSTVDQSLSRVSGPDDEVSFRVIGSMAALDESEELSSALKRMSPARLMNLVVMRPTNMPIADVHAARARLVQELLRPERGESVERAGAVIAAAQLLSQAGHTKEAQAIEAQVRFRLRQTLGAPPAPGSLHWQQIAGGKFTMGCSGSVECDSNELPTHSVTVPPFQILKHEVTVALAQPFVDNKIKLSEWATRYVEIANNKQQPLFGVNWYEAAALAFWLGGRLPTEAEWEFAARGGTRTAWWFGDDAAMLSYTDWGSGTKSVQPVCTARDADKQPFGLCDMHGNVYEWVQDWFVPYQHDPSELFSLPAAKRYRVLRGGAVITKPRDSRSSSRDCKLPTEAGQYVGFRIVRDTPH